MSQQEINGEILRSHATVKPQFFPHEGTMISDLYEVVERIQGPTEVCEWCYGTGIAEFRGDYSDDIRQEPCDCRCKHDWRGIDTGRVCAKCLKEERAR